MGGRQSGSPALRDESLSDAMDLMGAAHESLASARRAGSCRERAAAARLGVLRGAAAILAVRGAAGRASRPVGLWSVVAQVAPEVREWADFFVRVLPGHDGRTGHGDLPSAREADDLLRQGEIFLGLVAGMLGLPQATPTACLAPMGRPA